MSGGPQGSLWTAKGSSARPISEALAWLWRLGPVGDSSEPASGEVGLGGLDEAANLGRAVAEGRLAGAVIFAGAPGPAIGDLPERERVEGVAEFPGYRLTGEFIAFRSARGPVRSSLGTHAIERGRVLTLGCDERAGWGTLHLAWSLAAIATFLSETIGLVLTKLPRVGCIRVDDFPGTAEFQLEGVSKLDWRQARRAKRLVRDFARTGNTLNIATSCQALSGERPVPLESIWPKSVAELRRGVEAEAIETVCHGYLGLVPSELAEGRIEFREYQDLTEPEAGDLLDRVVEWQERRLGSPRTFVAVAWKYSQGTLDAALERGLPCWRRPEAASLISGNSVRETLIGSLPGIHGLDYSPLEVLADLGLPPILTAHGVSLDGRVESLAGRWNLVRVALRRDVFRLARIAGVRWIGAGTMVELFRRHEQTKP